MTLLPTAVTAQLDQLHANSGELLDRFTAVASEMAEAGMDPAERLALIAISLDEAALGRADLAGLVACAVLRLAERDAGAGS